MKSGFGKEIKVRKVYICLFTCGCTRAIHIELTPSLTTQPFIRCLRRFVARRGIPELIISNNAKAFKAATNQLTRIFSGLRSRLFFWEGKCSGSLILRKPHGGGILLMDNHGYQTVSEGNAWKGSPYIRGTLNSFN